MQNSWTRKKINKRMQRTLLLSFAIIMTKSWWEVYVEIERGSNLDFRVSEEDTVSTHQPGLPVQSKYSIWIELFLKETCPIWKNISSVYGLVIYVLLMFSLRHFSRQTKLSHMKNPFIFAANTVSREIWLFGA